MQFLLLTFPLITSLLFALVLRKCGFGLAGTMLGFLPLLGAALPMIVVELFRAGVFKPGVSVFALVPLAGQILGLVPLIVLVAVKWPVLPRIT